ncbi:MAG: protein phosphatase 2C domain-containing protein [Muribaculaceae bacterium]|nr:protein phosphatase 2C domain-containing protein [Muribaculaceae bacterium]
MNINQRRMNRYAGKVNRINDFARLLAISVDNAGVRDEERDDFLKWSVKLMYDNFKVERMNRRIEIEEEVRRCGIRFPNGTVGKEYEFRFTLPSEGISDVELYRTEANGLELIDAGQGEFILKGKPEAAGDFSLTLCFKTVAGEPVSMIKYPIAFNPDPRSLWKEIDTDKNIPYYKEDCAKQYIKVGKDENGLTRKDIVAASRRGRSHAQEGKARDDHFRIWHSDSSGWYVMAVADGAGSAKYSRKGSEVACDTVVEHCSKLLEDNQKFEEAIREFQADRENKEKRTEVTRHVIEIIYKGAMKAHEALKRVSAANGETKLKDFATTLMFAICKRYDFGWFVASFWVGDGAICLYDEESGTARLLGTPDEGEYSGQTRFLTMPEIFRDPEVVAKRMRLTVVPDFTALMLMTDGVSDPMFETENNLNDFEKWKEFYSTLRTGFSEDSIPGVDLTDDNEDSAVQLLRWLDFWSPGNHDDRTIAILY